MSAFLSPTARADDNTLPCIDGREPQGPTPTARDPGCTRGSVAESGRSDHSESEPVEMTVGSPPMISDDTETADPGSVEFNLVFNGEWARGQYALEAPLLDVNYGVNDHTQFKFELPYALVRRSDGDTSRQRGIGDTNTGIKYRFYSDRASGFALAVYPQVRFHTPGASRALSDAGTSITFPLLLTKEFARVSITVNLGVARNSADGRSDYFASCGLGTRVNDQWAVMAELAGDSLRYPDAQRYIANIGMRRKIDDKQAVVSLIGRDLLASDGSARLSYFTLAYQRVFGQ